jgi:hypothetical protein
LPWILWGESSLSSQGGFTLPKKEGTPAGQRNLAGTTGKVAPETGERNRWKEQQSINVFALWENWTGFQIPITFPGEGT